MSVLPSRRHVGQQIAAVGLDEDFRRGFIQMIPLWPGVVAFSIAYAIAARTAGFGPFEIVAMSALIFAGSAQVAAVALYASGAGFIPIVLTGLLLNVRHIFYGLSINRWLPERTTPPKPVLAFFLTDESCWRLAPVIRRRSGELPVSPGGQHQPLDHLHPGNGFRSAGWRCLTRHRANRPGVHLPAYLRGIADADAEDTRRRRRRDHRRSTDVRHRRGRADGASIVLVIALAATAGVLLDGSHWKEPG
ncbi:MAG: AzlC family ABC transporter permease [Thermomicrobiales bacterium]